jgi:ribonuclease P protein component
MITRVHRFHGHVSLPTLYRRANTARGLLMNVKYASRRADQPYRLAVVVSRKVSKSAVVRNKIRRRLYEAVRAQEGQFSGSYDIAIMVYNESVASLEYDELTRQLSDIFVKAGITTTNYRDIVKTTGKY